MASRALRWVPLLLAVGAAAPVGAQAVSAQCASKPATGNADDSTYWELKSLSGAEVKSLQADLRDSCWAHALGRYFSYYRPDLLDWVVYIDRDGRVTQALVKNGGAQARSSEERYVWAVVFSELPIKDTSTAHPKEAKEPATVTRIRGTDTVTVTITLAGKASGDDGGGSSAKPPANTLTFSRRVVLYHGDPMLTLLLKGLGRAVSLDAPTAPVLNDSSQAVALSPISSDPTVKFWVGLARFGLVENAEVELSLQPAAGTDFDSTTPPKTDSATSAGPADTASRQHPRHGIYTRVQNAKVHGFELGLLAGGTYGSAIPTYGSNLRVTGETPRLNARVYLTGVLNLWWFPVYGWRAPHHQFTTPSWDYASLGVFAGTSVLPGSIGDEVVAGLVAGHLMGDFGLAGGLDWTPAQHLRNGVLKNGAATRMLLGINAVF